MSSLISTNPMYFKQIILFIISLTLELDFGSPFCFGRVRWHSRSQTRSRNAIQSFSVFNNESGLRIDQFISSRKPLLSRNLLASLYIDGHVLCNEKIVLKKNKKVHFADNVAVNFTNIENKNTEIIPERIPLDILFEVFSNLFHLFKNISS